MPGVETRTFESPDETRTPDKMTLNVVKVGDASVMRMTAAPGWRWSESIKPIVGGEKCQAEHLGMLVSGKMHVVHEDGTEADLVPGEVYRIRPGHDAWVVGDESAVGFEFTAKTAETFAEG